MKNIKRILIAWWKVLGHYNKNCMGGFSITSALKWCGYFMLTALIVGCNNEQTNTVPSTQMPTAHAPNEETTEITSVTLTPFVGLTQPPTDQKQEIEPTPFLNGSDIIDLATLAMEDVISYEADHEYILDSDLVTEQSNDNDSFTSSSCNIIFQQDSLHCVIETTAGINGSLESSHSEMIIIGKKAWYQQTGNDWITIPSEDVRMPGLVEGLIQPAQFLKFAQDASLESEYQTPDRVLYEISFSLDVEPYIQLLLGDEKSEQLFNLGTDFSALGRVLIDKESQFIYEFDTNVDFMVDNVPARIQLTQSLSNFNEPVNLEAPED